MKVLLAFSDSFSSLILYQSPLYTCEEMSLKKADNILVLLIKQFLKKNYLLSVGLDLCVAQSFLWLWPAGTTLWLQCMGFSWWRCFLLWSMGSRVHGLSSCGSRSLEHRLNCCNHRLNCCDAWA